MNARIAVPLVVAAAVAYAYYRTALAPTEPFGPLYEWAAVTAICLALILFHVSASTKARPEAALPGKSVRHHSQSVRALRDPSYEILRGLLYSFVERGENEKELARELERLSSGFPPGMLGEFTTGSTKTDRRARAIDPVERERRLQLVRRVMERLEDGGVGG
ncbi:MAG: hypothetical protein HY556_00915 [Euryarchaeota archaeon]|nr:hypothetical protein [Euryarchaeota archaeon]